MLAAMSVTVLGWALLRLWFQSAEQRFQRAGDAQVWPFQTRSDYSQARRARAMLRGVSDDIE
jgi:hypothetical protein